jgi:hypothetical protein
VRPVAPPTLQPGIYVIAGGGFTVSNASISGSGVMIYNGGGALDVVQPAYAVTWISDADSEE